MAIRDQHGFIRLIDRKKNMIISGGENVYPTEVEAVLAQHPDVKDVAVVGRPDDIWGERVAAAVVLRDGAELDAEALIAWSRDRLAGYKRPRDILFLSADEMPRNTTGKILHRVLRDRFAGATDNRKESP
jgi:fatty-acyl-CoA synthase